MSHFTEIETQIRDAEALREACAELGLELLENADARGFSGMVRRGEYVVRLKGPYDIALNRQSDGSYSLEADHWNGHVERETGPNYGRLLQLYGVHKATREARRKGYTVRRSAAKNGGIKLSIGGMR